jgi:outer membrane murein-binding lipoprotein Lpp
MNRGLRNISFLLVSLLALSIVAGCTSVRTADTHNTTVAVQEYNAWVARQQGVDRDIRSTITAIGDHATAYNAEIVKDQPDYSPVRSNLAEDRQLLDRWGTENTALAAATDLFEKNTASLIYGNASETRTRQTLGQMVQYMKIYGIESENARQHLIEYVKNAEAYLGPDDPEYFNDQFRLDALQAKEQARGSLLNGDVALGNLSGQAGELEKIQ